MKSPNVILMHGKGINSILKTIAPGYLYKLNIVKLHMLSVVTMKVSCRRRKILLQIILIYWIFYMIMNVIHFEKSYCIMRNKLDLEPFQLVKYIPHILIGPQWRRLCSAKHIDCRRVHYLGNPNLENSTGNYYIKGIYQQCILWQFLPGPPLLTWINFNPSMDN